MGRRPDRRSVARQRCSLAGGAAAAFNLLAVCSAIRSSVAHATRLADPKRVRTAMQHTIPSRACVSVLWLFFASMIHFMLIPLLNEHKSQIQMYFYRSQIPSCRRLILTCPQLQFAHTYFIFCSTLNLSTSVLFCESTLLFL